MQFQLNIPHVAGALLLGIGIYFFWFERSYNNFWIILFLGAALNFYLGYKRNQEEAEQQEKP